MLGHSQNTKSIFLAEWPDGYFIFQYLAVYIIENLLSRIKIAKVGTIFTTPNQDHSKNFTKTV